MDFSIFTKLYKHHQFHFRTFYHPKKKHYANDSHSPLPPPALVNHLSYFLSILIFKMTLKVCSFLPFKLFLYFALNHPRKYMTWFDSSIVALNSKASFFPAEISHMDGDTEENQWVEPLFRVSILLRLRYNTVLSNWGSGYPTEALTQGQSSNSTYKEEGEGCC